VKAILSQVAQTVLAITATMGLMISIDMLNSASQHFHILSASAMILA
jgi:hypothetical protein